MKKVLCVLVAVLMVFTLMPVMASAASYDYILGDGDSLDISTATDGDSISVSGAVTLTGTKKVTVFCNAGATLTIDNLYIDVSATSTACPITFDGTGNTLILKNTSGLIAGYGEPAVKVLSGAALNITGGQSDVVSLTGGNDAAGLGGGEFNGAVGNITISGGKVQATGGENGAGIGAGINMSNGTVKITGGNVEAKGGSHAAGIGGGGDYGSGGVIEISGGVVKATGGIGGAGIGGGEEGHGGTITIQGGDVTATGGGSGAGIGSGNSSDESLGINGGTINISGGTIKAYGGGESGSGENGAGIGGGDNCWGGNITITGGTITAVGGNEAAGIGGGYYGDGGIINIGGTADVSATGGNSYGAGIGSGNMPYNEDVDTKITIYGDAKVTAQGGEYSAGIGGGENGSGGTIVISGGTINATGGDSGAGIGSGETSSNLPDVTISGGKVEAYGGEFAAGVGGGNNTGGGSITVKGSADVAAHGIGGAGIGGGNDGDGGIISIEGGKVYALGDSVFDGFYLEDCGAAGIGGGIGGMGGTITISGGDVTAISTEYGAGIGSGDGYPQEDGSAPPLTGGIITILGGTVNANGGYCGAGIGGGYYSHSGIITISGGAVNASGGESAAGIGGGVMGDGQTINISGGGTVNAVSEGYGAGIGGGEEGYGGIINILGGTIYALSEQVPEVVEPFVINNEHNSELFISQLEIPVYVAAAGIGDGASGVEPVVSEFITNREANSEITISGGLVYAGGPVGDIGPGALILISGGSAVFLKNDFVNIDPPFVPDGHIHKTSSDSKDPLVFSESSVYGIKVASEWTDATGGYFKLYTLDYDANGGSGGFEMIVAGGQEITLDDGAGLTNDGYVFTGWNTQSDNEGTGYNGGGKMLMPLEDKTLYAVWEEDTGGQRGIIGAVLTDENGNPLPGYTIELHSVVLTGITDADGKVTFSNVSFEDHTLIIKNSSDVVVATFTLKMSEGSASGYVINGSEIDITYTGHTVSVQIDISFDGEEATIEDVTILDNPDTGSHIDWLVWAAIVSALMMIAAMFALRRRVNNNKY